MTTLSSQPIYLFLRQGCESGTFYVDQVGFELEIILLASAS